MSARKNFCDTCRFFQPTDTDAGIGECRRYAPRPVPGRKRGADGDSTWLIVMDFEWCGEWEDVYDHEEAAFKGLKAPFKAKPS